MKEYIKNNKKFIEYCKNNGLSYDKLMKSPKSYGDNIIYFQVIGKRGHLGLNDDRPAKVILTIEKQGEELIFKASDDIRDFVGETEN